jgi:hypothetical protein
MEEVIAAAEKRHELRELVELGHNGDSPILTLVVLGPSPPDIKPLHTPSAVETKRDCADGLTRRFDCRNL